jgi:hypothetical protein
MCACQTPYDQVKWLGDPDEGWCKVCHSNLLMQGKPHWDGTRYEIMNVQSRHSAPSRRSRLVARNIASRKPASLCEPCDKNQEAKSQAKGNVRNFV